MNNDVKKTNPVLVEVVRDPLVESRHRGSVAVADARGRLRLVIGDVQSPVYLRSAIKFLQAIPLVASGAAARYALDDTELALACGSHGGEARHTRAVGGWLRRIGLAPDDLACGVHQPMYRPAAEALAAAGGAATALHNNCSGKHTGFLTTALHCGEPLDGYIAPGHPVQQRVRRTLEAMCGLSLEQAPAGTDGCGIPVFGIPLAAVAGAMARFALAEGLAAPHRDAVLRLQRALRARPFFAAGSKRLCSALMERAGDRALVKVGAEGCYAGALPGAGLGIALKIDDGAERAAEVAMGALLGRLAPLTGGEREGLQSWLCPSLCNRAQREVGRLRPAPALHEALESYG